MYARAFTSGQVGSAAAVGITLTVIIALISFGINKLSERATMTSRSEQTLGYVILGLFSIFALVPIVGIVFTALQPDGGGAAFGSFSGFHFGNFKRAWVDAQLRAVPEVERDRRGRRGLASRCCCRCSSGYAFGLMRFRGQNVLFYVFLLGLMVPMEAIIVPLYYTGAGLGPDQHLLGR